MQMQETDRIKEYGQAVLMGNEREYKILLMTVIGEVEGHENVPDQHKTTRYDHILPMLAMFEDSQAFDGMLMLLNTQGGDVDAGLAIAEMIASLSKPTVSLVLGGSHSIGVPLAVSADYSLIVPTGTMMIHPVRMNGLIIGVAQTFDYFQKIQDRISGFIVSHSRISEERLMKLMLETGELTKDVGSVLVGRQAVDEGLIDGIGGIREAFAKLRELIRMENAGSCK